MDRKRILYIVLFIAALVLFVYAFYAIFLASPPPKTRPAAKGTTPTSTTSFPSTTGGRQPGTNVTQRTGLPISGTAPQQTTEITPPARTIALTNLPNRGTAMDTTGGIRFYNNRDGRFYRVTKDGKIELLSDEVFYSVQNVTWSPSRSESILEYPDGSNIYYNFDSKKKVTLPKHWEKFTFSPAGDKIVAESIGLSPENRWLVISNPDGSSVSPIEPLGENGSKVIVDWSPNSQIIALSQTGEAMGADRQQILPVGLNGENFKGLIVEGRGLQTQWSPQGKKLLYSVYNANGYFKPELWIDNAEPGTIGSGRRTLNINTWASKCTFSDERFIYCGVPKALPTGAGFAPQIADSISDNLYKIDLQTGIKTQITTDEEHTIQEIYVDQQAKALYFTDKNKDGVFKTSL